MGKEVVAVNLKTGRSRVWCKCSSGVLALVGGVAAVALWSGTAGAAQPLPAAPPRFAIVIGNNQPETAGPSVLRYADDDALSTHALLVEAGVDSVLLARPDADTRRMHPDVVPLGPPRGEVLDAAVAASSIASEPRRRTARAPSC